MPTIMVRSLRSPSKSKHKKAEEGRSRLSFDAAAGRGNGETPTTASELKALLKKSLENAQEGGIANAASNAQSESPLLVRADTATPEASPNARSSSKKDRTESRLQGAKPHAGAAESWSTTSTPRDEPNTYRDRSSTDASVQHGGAHLRISGPRLNLSIGGVFGFSCLGGSTCVPRWGADRLIRSMGSLRTTAQSAASASPPPLSPCAQRQLQSLEPIAKKCWIELYVEKCDELPFGVYSKPQVHVHLVDRFTGQAIHPTQTTSPAKLNYSCSYASK